MSRRRILHVIQNLNYGGMERMLADLVTRSDPARFEHHVLVLQYLGRFSQEMAGVATLHQAAAQPRWSLLRPAALARQMAAIAPDVVHTHSGVWYKASLAARMARVPLVVHTEHGRATPDPLVARVLDGLASRRTDVVVAVSDVLAAQLGRTVVRGRRARIAVVTNGVDTARFAPRPATGWLCRELGLPAGTPIVGSIGRLEHIKGYDVMIRAFAELGERAPAAHLVVGGEGAERPRLEAVATALGTRGRVHLLGWRDDIEAMLAEFTLFTMSSRSEGTSVSLLEAMSSGLCPVVTDVGGNAAVLGGSLAHRLVPPGDVMGLAGAWVEALEHPDRRQEDGATARARVRQAFSLEAMVRGYEAIYDAGPRAG